MSRFDELLGVDFDGVPSDDVDDVIYEGLDDPRHRERVPGLVGLLNDTSAPPRDRYLACLALTTWGEAVAYQTVIKVAQNPQGCPWYEISIDRMHSIDNTFAQLAAALGDSYEIANAKGTTGLRNGALRALLRIADTEYFEGKLHFALKTADVAVLLEEITTVVSGGVDALAAGEPARLDLACQFMDLAAAAATVDGKAAVDLARQILAVAAHHRVRNHAIAVIQPAGEPEVTSFGEYLMAISEEDIREQVRSVLAPAPHAVLERLRGAPWRDWDAAMAHRDSRAVLMREYLRRAAAWARATGAEEQWPFFDLAGRLRPGWEPEPALLAALDDIFVGQEPGGRVRATCHAAVRWAALREADPGLTLPPLPDPYEPLLLMYERGGGFYIEEFIELDGVAIRRGTLESNLSPGPFLNLHPAALDSLDEEGDIRYYAKTDESHPRFHPRGIVRRRVTATATHDEAFTRNLRWEPTEYLRRYDLGNNDVDHMEISAREAVLFMERILVSHGA